MTQPELTTWLNEKPWARSILTAFRMDGLVGYPTVTLIDEDTKTRRHFESQISFRAAFEGAAQFVRENP